MNRVLWYLLVLCLLFITSLVMAEEMKTEKEVIEIESVVVTAPRRDALPAGANVPAAVESITRETIESINVTGTEDIVKYQPGVNVVNLMLNLLEKIDILLNI